MALHYHCYDPTYSRRLQMEDFLGGEGTSGTIEEKVGVEGQVDLKECDDASIGVQLRSLNNTAGFAKVTALKGVYILI